MAILDPTVGDGTVQPVPSSAPSKETHSWFNIRSSSPTQSGSMSADHHAALVDLLEADPVSLANTAQQIAETAQDAADSAQSTANTANNTAAGAQTTADAALPMDGGTMTGAIHQTPGVQAFSAHVTIDASANNTHKLSGPITSDFDIAINNAVDGDCGVLHLVQDGTGNHKITGITCPGFTVRMVPATAVSINTSGFKAANAPSALTYQCVETFCYVSMGDSTSPGYA
jgi:hypothetical protein